jgi:hypothetical protein
MSDPSVKFTSSEYVIDISPTSQRILILKRDASDIVLRVRMHSDTSLVFERRLDNNTFREALFTSDSTLLVISESQSPFLLNTNNGTSIVIDRLNGKEITGIWLDVNSHKLAIVKDLGDMEGGNLKMSIGLYDLATREESEYAFKRSGNWVFDAKVYGEHTFLVNYHGNPVLVNTKTKHWDSLLDQKGRPLTIGESRINVVHNRSVLFFSMEGNGGLATYSIGSRQLRIVKRYDQFINPLLAPDESFFIATNLDVKTHEDNLFDDVSILREK